MPYVLVDAGKRCDRDRHQSDMPAAGQPRCNENINSARHEPRQPQRMRDGGERGERKNEREVAYTPRTPGNRDSPKRKRERKVVVEEAHVKRVAVGEHRKRRSEAPRGAFRGRSGEREHSPEKRQHAQRDGHCLRMVEREHAAERIEQVIEEDVRVLMSKIKSRHGVRANRAARARRCKGGCRDRTRRCAGATRRESAPPPTRRRSAPGSGGQIE